MRKVRGHLRRTEGGTVYVRSHTRSALLNARKASRVLARVAAASASYKASAGVVYSKAKGFQFPSPAVERRSNQLARRNIGVMQTHAKAYNALTKKVKKGMKLKGKTLNAAVNRILKRR